MQAPVVKIRSGIFHTQNSKFQSKLSTQTNTKLVTHGSKFLEIEEYILNAIITTS